MRRVCESVSSLINPCRRWQFPSVKYQSTVYKSLTKNYYYCTKSFTADSLSSHKRFFPPRKKDIKRRQKISLFLIIPLRADYIIPPFPSKKGDFPQIPRRKKEDKNAPVPPCCSILFPDLLLPSAGNRGGCTVGVCN